jgi:putative ABC transport system permease protein
VRNPARTAATASALMIGLGVVVFVAVFAQGLKSSFVDAFDKVSRADFVVQSQGFVPLPGDTAARLQSLPGVQTAAGLDMQQVQVAGKTSAILGIDPALFKRVWRFDWLGGGSDALLGRLGSSNAIVEEQTASTLGAKVGKTITVVTMDGRRKQLTVTGLYRDPMMLNGIVVGDAGYTALFPTPQQYMVFVGAAPGTDLAQEADQLKAALASVPTAEVKTAQEYKDSLVGQVNSLLNLVYGLLAMSVIISLFGIVNTLVLAVYERTREIGLLRAIGSSRRQVRATVRYESVITSIIGALMGIVVGIAFAWVVTTKFAGQGITFSIPGGQLVVFLVVGVIVGVVAAILPARRAAKIDILEAIHYE